MDNSAPLSAGHLLVKELEAHGVQRAYLVPGESYLDVLDGLHDSTITPIVCRQEGGAGYMAVAEGRMTGIPGIAMVTRGPGASNVMVSLHTAYQDATPLVVFVGLIPTAQRGRESFQEFDLNGWFSTTTKKVLTLDDPDKAAEVVTDAMHTAVTGRPGPVVVGLPEEVLVQASKGEVLTPRVHGSAAPYSGDVTELRARILQADRPVLIIGGEDWSPATSRRIAQWSHDRGLGVIGTFRAYDGIDHDSPNFLGILGFGASAVATRTFAEADLHIFLGCVRTDVATNGFTIGTDAKTVVIGPDADAHGHFGSLDQHIITSVSRFAQALFTADGARAYSVSSDGSIDEPAVGDEHLAGNDEPVALPDWILDARAELDEWRVPVTASAHDSSYVDMDEAFVHVKELLPDNAIITYGAGNFSGWATRFLPTHGFPSALGPRNGSMGFGLPAAVAAGLVHPERTVFCIAGDGDCLMNGQELATATQYGVNLTVVVNDNSVYGTILGHQDREYPGRATGTALRSPDFAAMATAFGGLGLTVERTEDFRDAFEQALAYEGPALVRCLTDPTIRGARV